jgi:perosamine synthetase
VIPYGRQQIDSGDIEAVVEALHSAWLTTGPRVEAFESAFSAVAGVPHAVAVNSGTAALHVALHALGVGPGDEVIVPAITFAASSNAVLYNGARPVFADIEADTLLIDPVSIERKLTSHTKAIVAVDYAGQPADYDALYAIARPRSIRIVADACHAPGARYQDRPVGSLADISAFSFHPVKHITTGEGGLATTADEDIARRMRCFRNHGIDTDARSRESKGSFDYDMAELGYNYRLPDILCALGIAQLPKLDGWVHRRQEIARMYDEAFASMAHVRPLATRPDRTNARHLYVVRLVPEELAIDRNDAFRYLRAAGIGANVHYKPVYLHSYYRDRLGFTLGLCPTAEAVSTTILTLPLYPAMRENDIARVIDAVDALRMARPSPRLS